MNKITLKEFSAILIGFGIASVIYRVINRGKTPLPKIHFHPSQHFAEGDWDRVDESSWESFPASDPPSHSPPRQY